jgi:uncharacterized protein
MTALHTAIEEWNDDLIQWLLERQTEIDTPDDAGNTPLMLAARQGIYEQHIQALLDRGANLHATNQEGMTPLYLALETITSARSNSYWTNMPTREKCRL